MKSDFPRGRNWRSAPVYDKPKSARLILARALGISADEAGDALVALMQAGYGIAPRNPTNGMLCAYMEALTPPTHHESVITAIGKARVRWQAMMAEGCAMAMSTKRIASADTLPEGQDAQQGLAGTESGAVGNAETPSPSPSPAAGR